MATSRGEGGLPSPSPRPWDGEGGDLSADCVEGGTVDTPRGRHPIGRSLPGPSSADSA